ncbi:Hypothetical_protein [Hexamita inflata]|uniref:Hypothetical_protein n=1 Tax=Hexamita inflata TaxID=28002 RepID=A0AA86QUI2_9EUKA|nr:Hypothetical protein HINF_LOCUS21335 [Hexamita inflata]CAI9963397.1 Hypothetical protein HINF_LOCUS51042 [Hexamita inflata]
MDKQQNSLGNYHFDDMDHLDFRSGLSSRKKNRTPINNLMSNQMVPQHVPESINMNVFPQNPENRPQKSKTTGHKTYFPILAESITQDVELQQQLQSIISQNYVLIDHSAYTPTQICQLIISFRNINVTSQKGLLFETGIVNGFVIQKDIEKFYNLKFNKKQRKIIEQLTLMNYQIIERIQPVVNQVRYEIKTPVIGLFRKEIMTQQLIDIIKLNVHQKSESIKQKQDNLDYENMLISSINNSYDYYKTTVQFLKICEILSQINQTAASAVELGLVTIQLIQLNFEEEYKQKISEDVIINLLAKFGYQVHDKLIINGGSGKLYLKKVINGLYVKGTITENFQQQMWSLISKDQVKFGDE